MEKIKIRYKKRIQRWFLYFGIGWALLGAAMFFTEKKSSWLGYAYLALGVLGLIIFLYYNEKQYVTIRDGVLTKNAMLLSKSIPLDEIKRIRYFAGDYTLISGRTELHIDSNAIDKGSMEKLESVLKSLDAKWDRPPIR